MNARVNPNTKAPSAPGSMNRADRVEHDDLQLELVTEERPAGEHWRGHLTRKNAPTGVLPASGDLPKELYGHLFVNSACGTVTSGGLPLRGAEVTTILAGDGYLMRFDLDGDAGTVKLKTRLLRTPCFYVDEITRQRKDLALYRFFNHGILRFNWLLGARNMNNTAFYPLPAKDQDIERACRLLVTWDAGRPWEIDPVTLEPKTPVGYRKEWAAEAFGTHPFPVTFGTAHPQWDPDTQEFFAINYGKGMDALMRTVPIMNTVHRVRKAVGGRWNDFLFSVGLERVAEARMAVFMYLDRKRTEVQDRKPPGFLPERFTYLLRWDGKGAIQRFQMVRRENHDPIEEKVSAIARFLGRKAKKDKEAGVLGASVGIEETVHQMACTKNFIVVLDTGFKVGLDALYGDPLPFLPALRGLFKTLTTRTVTPYSTFYIVRRDDMERSLEKWEALTDDQKRANRTPDVEATVVRVPSAACHFVADYEDDGREVVLHVAHSDATDVGEWVRPGAKNPYTDGVIHEDYYGLPGVSAIDTNRVARYTVDVDGQRVSDSQVMSRNPFTWTVALYAQRTAGIPTQFASKIKSLYWNSMGFFPEIATAELRELYRDYIHRKTPIAEIDCMPDTGGRPSTLMRIDAENFVIADHFIFPPGFVCSTPQFLPRKRRRRSVPEDQDGYLSAMVFPPDPPEGDKAVPELWIFDARDLGRGPLCMLRHPKFKVGFTIHSAWMGDIEPYDPSVYKVDLREDFKDALANLRRGVKLKPVFEDEIFPKFD